MAFYFSSDTNALYDTDVFPVASLPANKVEITSEAYAELLTKQNQGYVILADGSGNPYTVNQSEASATDIKHAASVATTLALGHVKIGTTMQAANDGTLDLKDGAVTTAKIVDANVTADKLATDSVTTAKITDANVTADKLATDSVTTAKIADGSVTTAKIVDANVTADKLATDSVTTAKITDANVTADKLASNSVTTAKIVDANVTADKLASNSVTTAKITDANVTADKLASDSVTTAKIVDANVTADKLATDSVTTEKIADGAVTEEKLGSVKDLAADESTLTMTEDANGFTIGVKDGGIDANQIANQAIRTHHLNTYAVTTEKISDGAVNYQKLAASAVETSKIAGGAVTADKLATNSVTTEKIADGGVTHEKLASTFLFWDPNFSSNYSTPKSDTTLTGYCTNNCNGKSASIIFLKDVSIFQVDNGVIPNTTKTYYEEGSTVLIVNMSSATQSDPGNIVVENVSSAMVLKDIASKSSAMFVCLYKGSSSNNYNDAIWIAVS